MRWVLICIASITGLFASITSDDDSLLLPSLKGIAVFSHEEDLNSNPELNSLGIWIDPALQDLNGRLAEIILSEISQPLTKASLENLKSEIAAYFQNERHLLVSVVVPPQDISDCTIQVIVRCANIDRICLKGNRWTSDHWILSGTNLKEGCTIQIDQLERNLAWLNRSPFRRTDLVLRSGENQGTTSVDLLTSERFPFRPYVGGDNTGTSFTSQARWYTGFYAGYLWARDHQASYQFTTASEPEIFVAHSASYLIPFSWRHQLYFYGGWSRVKGKLEIPGMHNKGTNWQVSGRYQIPINPIYGNFLQEFTFGYDFKRTNNGLIFESITFSKNFADINQFMASYYADYRGKSFKTSFNIEVFASPFKITGDQTNSQYQGIRPYAKNKYIYGKARFSHTHFLPKGFSVLASIVGQGTGWNLMPSEQYGIGGYDTVRGYGERAYNADDAFLASFELRTPETRLFDWRKVDRRQEKLYFLAFIDYGWGKLHKPFFGQKSPEWLCGVGPGVRYSYATNVYFRGDLGVPLHKAGLGRHGVYFHVGGTLSY